MVHAALSLYKYYRRAINSDFIDNYETSSTDSERDCVRFETNLHVITLRR